MNSRSERQSVRFQKFGQTARIFSRCWRHDSGFTLIELMAVIALIMVLATLLALAVNASLDRAQASRCQSNIRQLFFANTLYAADHGSYVAAAPDIFGQNLSRWHGLRDSIDEPFDGSRGPLYEYLSRDNSIRQCPSFKNYRSGAAYDAFEDSCGGYGYNDRGVGSRAYWYGYNKEGVTDGMPPSVIHQPAATVMFCDTAFLKFDDNAEYLIEYSFAEAYHFLDGTQSDPTIHFRHRGRANVVWCDGHVSSEPMTITKEGKFIHYNIGWFGAADNGLFDLL